MPYDRWHKQPSKDGGDKLCAHKKVPSKVHGQGSRWQARWRDPNGEQLTELFEREADARAHETAMRAGSNDGSYIDPKGGELTVEELIEKWLKGQTVPPRTLNQYRSRVRLHILKPLGKHKIKSITASVIREWIADRKQHLDETTVALILSHLQSMLDLAVDDDLIRKNPCLTRSVKAVKPRRAKMTAKDLPLTWQQTEEIRTALPDRFKAMVDVGRGLGLRQGEIFGLSPDDLDWEHVNGPMVHVQRQIAMDGSTLVWSGAKGDNSANPKDRWVELDGGVGSALKQHMATFPPIPVTLPKETKDGELETLRVIFYSRERKPVNRNYFNSFVWKPALAAAGIIAPLKPGRKRKWEKSRDKMMHALRHLFASMALEHGVDIYTLSDRLGHSDPAFTLRKYVHRVPNAGAKLRAALRNIYEQAA
ncbi:site-specific integrase [Streptomyces sp. NBC_00820]|uniref:tyrosine-type recombinase/integrase n=1 Tax=Streptomyces sp. NBC_00820 TaxID=2975842 RepID=UPI002ED0C3BD|nr:site-specific integrase [Streptomyces sp. NBC_00820]